MTQHAQKAAIVTGASRGIGAAIARRLAADGYGVVVNYAGNATAAAAVVKDIEAGGGRAIAVQADVGDPAAVRELFAAARAAFGRIDVLVNNAGVMSLADVADTDDASAERMIDVNLRGTFNTLRAAAKAMEDGGRVVNFSSSVVGMRLPTYGIYAATKAAVETLTAVFAKELRGRNITVNAIAPGPTATDLFLNGKSAERVEQLANMAPLQRLGQPEDIAAAVSFLVGPDGAWVNGQTLRANGGII